MCANMISDTSPAVDVDKEGDIFRTAHFQTRQLVNPISLWMLNFNFNFNVFLSCTAWQTGENWSSTNQRVLTKTCTYTCPYRQCEKVYVMPMNISNDIRHDMT